MTSKKSLYPGTLILIGINVLVFIVTDLILYSSDIAFIRGGVNVQTVVNEHQYYRLITAMFLHVDLNHVFNNMISLAVFGSYTEEYLGKIKFFLLYFFSGIIANIFTIVYNMSQQNDILSVGASGAIFGLMGALLYLVRKMKVYKTLDRKRMIFLVIFSLYSGFATANVNNTAHISGLAAGFFICFLLTLNVERNITNYEG